MNIQRKRTLLGLGLALAALFTVVSLAGCGGSSNGSKTTPGAASTPTQAGANSHKVTVTVKDLAGIHKKKWAVYIALTQNNRYLLGRLATPDNPFVAYFDNDKTYTISATVWPCKGNCNVSHSGVALMSVSVLGSSDQKLEINANCQLVKARPGIDCSKGQIRHLSGDMPAAPKKSSK